MFLGATGAAVGNPAQAREYFEESVRLGRQVGDRFVIASSLAFLAAAHALGGAYLEALAVGKEALAVAREFAFRRAMTTALLPLSAVARCLGRREEAAEFRAERV